MIQNQIAMPWKYHLPCALNAPEVKLCNAGQTFFCGKSDELQTANPGLSINWTFTSAFAQLSTAEKQGPAFLRLPFYRQQRLQVVIVFQVASTRFGLQGRSPGKLS